MAAIELLGFNPTGEVSMTGQLSQGDFLLRYLMKQIVS
jgi:hypothetical protein